jgi:ribosomal protein L13
MPDTLGGFVVVVNAAYAILEDQKMPTKKKKKRKVLTKKEKEKRAQEWFDNSFSPGGLCNGR